MISIDTVVTVVLFLMGCAAIFGLLHYLVRYIESKFPSFAPFAAFAHVFLVIAAVLVLIGLILELIGHPLIAWRRI